jgi:Transposase zinc-binding domain
MVRARCAFFKLARKELLGYLDCGLLCRGLARLKCADCGERRLVAFSCKGRGFCPSCTGRRMNATAANRIERALPPQSGLRQWVLTFPFSWRRRVARTGIATGQSHLFHLRSDGRERRRDWHRIPAGMSPAFAQDIAPGSSERRGPEMPFDLLAATVDDLEGPLQSRTRATAVRWAPQGRAK